MLKTKMASAASKKKGKVKGKTVNLNDFLSSDGKAPGSSYVMGNQDVPHGSWADQSDDSGLDTTTAWDAGDYNKRLPDRADLPTAPRSAQRLEIDRSKLPDKPPYTVYLGNIPFDAEEEDISNFLRNCNVSQVRLPREGESGRLKGFGYAELNDMESLLAALQLNEQTLRSRRIRVDIASQAQSEGREGGHGREGGFDRTEDDIDWRQGGGQSSDSGFGGSYGRGGERDDRYGDRGGGFDRDRRGGRGFDNYEDNRRSDSRRDDRGGRGFENYNQDRGGYGRDRDGGRGFDNYNRDRRDGGDRYGDRDRGYGGGRDRGFGGDRGSGGDRDRGYGGDRDRGYGGDRDRGYGGDRDRGYGGDRDRGFGGDRDRGFGGDRDRGYGGERDRGYGGDRDRGYGGERDRGFGGDRDRGYGGDRDRGYGGDRERGYGGDRDRGYGGDRDRGGERGPDDRDPPRERKKLVLEKRSKPIETPSAKTSSAIFGSAKPVDTAAREREIEARLAKEREDADAERLREIERKERIDRGSASSRRESDGDEGTRTERPERRSRHSSSGSGKSGPRPVMIRRESERSNPEDDVVFKKDDMSSQPKSPSTPISPKSPLSPKSPKSTSSPPKADESHKVMKPAPPPKENPWKKRSEAATSPPLSHSAAAPASRHTSPPSGGEESGSGVEKKYIDAPLPKENAWGKRHGDLAGRGSRPSGDSRGPGGAGRGRRDDDRHVQHRDDGRRQPRDDRRGPPPKGNDRRGPPRDEGKHEGGSNRSHQEVSSKKERPPRELPKYEEPKPTDWAAPNKFSSLMEDGDDIVTNSD